MWFQVLARTKRRVVAVDWQHSAVQDVVRVRRAQELAAIVDNPDLRCAQASSYRGASAARLSLDASPVVDVRLRLEVVRDE